MNLPLKLNCISLSWLKILSHVQKNFEKSNVEIVRRVVNRQSYERTIHSLDDLCVIYDIASEGVYTPFFVNHLSSCLYTSLFKYRPSSLQERKDIEHLWNYKIIAKQSLSYEQYNRHIFFKLISNWFTL